MQRRPKSERLPSNQTLPTPSPACFLPSYHFVNREHLIQRYEHNYSGWVVTVKRRGKRIRRYFSDQSKGRRNALRAARGFRDKLVAQLPPPTKIKRTDVRNTTGVIGVARVKERTRSAKRSCGMWRHGLSTMANAAKPAFR